MNMTNQPTVRKAAEGRTIAAVGDVYRFLATGEDTNGKYAVWEAIVPPGGGPPPHVHSREEEGPVAQGATNAAPPTKEEIEKLLEIAPRYGIEIRPPTH